MLTQGATIIQSMDTRTLVKEVTRIQAPTVVYSYLKDTLSTDKNLHLAQKGSLIAMGTVSNYHSVSNSVSFHIKLYHVEGNLKMAM